MFAHSFKNTFKLLLRNRALVFWSLVFPLFLGFFFKLALGNIDKAGKFEVIPVSVKGELLEDEFFKSFIDSLEEEEYIKVSKSDNLDLLTEDKVVAHIESKDKITTKGSGIRETIIEGIIKSFSQNEATVIRAFQDNPQADINKLLKVSDYIEDKTNPNMNTFNTYFYTLVGMQAMYCYSWGMEVMYQYEANLSTVAKRNNMGPIKKTTSLATSLLVAWIISIVVVFINILVAKYVMGVEFGDKILPIIALVFLCSLTGVAFGALIAVSNKKEMEAKIGMGISITMLLSFLAGMMMAQMKVIVQKNAPFINKINPVALVTDGIYSLYYYNSMDRYYNNMIWLAGVTIVLIGLTLVMTRGKKYDNL